LFLAAHCILYKNEKVQISPRDVIIVLGAYDLNDPYEPGTLSVSPSEIIVHPHWNPFVLRFDADIAMLFMENSIHFSKSIVPICILNLGEGLEIQEGLVVGYGQSEDKTKDHETIPRVLNVPIKTNEDCFLENYQFAKLSSKRTFCAGPKNGMGACRGETL
jgi:Trypsin